jgi:hypothetical protein
MAGEPDDPVEPLLASPELALVDPALAQELRLNLRLMDDLSTPFRAPAEARLVAEEVALVDEGLDRQPSETDLWDAEDTSPLPDFIV